VAFWHLFHGRTSAQTWMHPLDMDQVLERHERYLRGSPFKTRKVVFDEEIHEQIKMPEAPFTVVKQESLHAEFKEALKDHIEQARVNDEKVLVLMVGHGFETSIDFDFPRFMSKVDQVPDIKSFIRSLNLGEEGKMLDVMIITAACYSGGWICNPISSPETPVAGAETDSRSCLATGSSRHISASMFTHPITDRMKQGLVDLEDSDDDGWVT
jgi:hypothetical protein